LRNTKHDPQTGTVKRGGNPQDQRVAENELEKMAPRIGKRQFAKQARPGRAEEKSVVRDEWDAPMIVVRGPHENVERGGQGKRESEKEWFEPAHEVKFGALE
jgi:hypothetical protein